MTALTVRSWPKGRLPTLRRERSFVDEATTPILRPEQTFQDKESTVFPEIDISITTKRGCHTSSCRNLCLPAAQHAKQSDCLCFQMFLQRRQEEPFQTSSLQSTESNPTSVTYDILYWFNPSPNYSSVFPVAYYRNIVTLQCTILSLCFPWSLCCISLHLFYLTFFFPSSVSLNLSFFDSSPSLFISTFPSFFISFSIILTSHYLLISSSQRIFLYEIP